MMRLVQALAAAPILCVAASRPPSEEQLHQTHCDDPALLQANIARAAQTTASSEKDVFDTVHHKLHKALILQQVAQKRRQASAHAADAKHAQVHPHHLHEGNEGQHEGHSEAGEHSHHHGFVALLFFFGTLTIGSLVLFFNERYFPSMQSTNVLFVCGSLVSVVHFMRTGAGTTPLLKDWFDSVDMWQGISPHMVFFAFLPVLIFGEAMQMKTSLFAKTIGQIALLACPGVLIGTVLVAAFSKYVMPYSWDWPVALAFGSVMSATDPVAVVALFNTLGVSPRLTMLVSGESLLNDGTAICVFTLMMNIIHGAEASASSILSFFVHMCGAAVLSGWVMGLVTCMIIGICAKGHYASDSMIQFMATLCCAYLSFFVTDKELSSSGVLAVVTSGLVVAHYAWPRFVHRETILEVWEAMLFVANTVIFFLGGLLFTDICLERRDHICINDVFLLGALYVALHFIRAFMMAVLWCPLNCAGEPISLAEGSVMVWSGLRGAVSLAMAITFDLDPGVDAVKGSRMMFHVGGIAMLTMFINSGLTPALLRLLGLTEISQFKSMMLDSFNAKMHTQIRERYSNLRNSDDARFAGVPDDLVQQLMPELARTKRFSTDEAEPIMIHAEKNPQDLMGTPLLQIYRECFVRLLTHAYWNMIAEGVLPKNYVATHLLLQSCQENLDTSKQPLSDWRIIARFAETIVNPSIFSRMTSALSKDPLFDGISMFQDTFDLDAGLRKTVCASLCFRAAHHKAQEEMMDLFGKGTSSSNCTAVMDIVHAESQRQCQLAEAFVKQYANADIVEFEKGKMTAQALLQHKIHAVHHMKEQGMLNGMEASLLENESLAAIEKVLHPAYVSGGN